MVGSGCSKMNFLVIACKDRIPDSAVSFVRTNAGVGSTVFLTITGGIIGCPVQIIRCAEGHSFIR